MIIALDFDETYTKDPQLWNVFCTLALKEGHKVYCVTARHPDHLNEINTTLGRIIGVGNVIATNLEPKRLVCFRDHGISPDIWIDDCPEAIPGIKSIYKEVDNETTD